MTSRRFTQIGLDRLVRLAWLEKVATLALAGNDIPSAKTFLQEDLAKSFQSKRTDVRGSLDKTITVLLKIWVSPPEELKSFCTEGLELLQESPRHNHMAIHWGMVSAVYPFWSSVAMQVGRLLRLQNSVASLQVQRRIREEYGERETVSRRTRYIIRSFLDWGVLQETGEKGVYSAVATLDVNDSKLIAWLVEASLHVRANGSAPLKELIDSPSLFPFRIESVHAESLVASSSRLDLLRHGLYEGLVMLRR